MARGNNNFYICLDTPGNTARQPNPEQTPVPRRKVPKPRLRKVEVVRIAVDPLALCSLVVAVGMFLALIAGCIQLHSAQQERDAMAAYVASLEEENETLRQTYADRVDLEQVEQAALAAGMVPVEQVTHIPISVPPETEEPVEAPTLWQRIIAFVKGLFA